MLILNQTVNSWCFNEKLDLYPIFLHPKSLVHTYARACTQFHRLQKYNRKNDGKREPNHGHMKMEKKETS